MAEPGDPGSPYAIGDERGGHDALHAELGTWEDFDALVATLGEHGMELCLDLAINASADHPWLTEHPEWFNRRPDGTAEVRREPAQEVPGHLQLQLRQRGLAGAVAGLARGRPAAGCAAGVTVFRVDNPHTKPLAFWEWLIAEVRREDPEVLFLAEAFTRRAVMRALAKAGFNQSYTYFTWKNAKWELEQYLTELTTTDEREYFRPNFFVNTPDILSDYLQHGGPRGLPGAPRAGRHPVADLRGLLRLRELRARRRPARQRGVPGLREVRGAQPAPRRPPPADDRAASTRRGGRTRRCSASTTSASSTPTTTP